MLHKHRLKQVETALSPLTKENKSSSNLIVILHLPTFRTFNASSVSPQHCNDWPLRAWKHWADWHLKAKHKQQRGEKRKKKKITWSEQLAVRPEGQYVKRCQPTKREVWCSCTSLQWVQIIKTMDLTHHTESKLGPCPLEEIRVMLFPLFYFCLLWTVVHVKLFKLWTTAGDVAQATPPLWFSQETNV